MVYYSPGVIWQPEDVGQPVVVLSQQSLVESSRARLYARRSGCRRRLHRGQMRINSQAYNFEVVGIVSGANQVVPNFGGAFLPSGILNLDSSAYVRINMLDVAPENVEQVLTNLSTVPLVLAVDVSFIDSLMTRLIEQMSAIPTLVGVLSLGAAAVIMGNTVSLATLERRQQIGVLKAMGLKRQRVLRVMLLENIVIGLLGGLLGIALSALGVGLMTALGTGVPVPCAGRSASYCRWALAGLSGHRLVGDDLECACHSERAGRPCPAL